MNIWMDSMIKDVVDMEARVPFCGGLGRIFPVTDRDQSPPQNMTPKLGKARRRLPPSPRVPQA